MRWRVLVTSISSGAEESFVVEGESWQKALQAARAVRGDSTAMNGFSIELLDDGCRAVDPMARLRFEVKRARDDAPLTPPKSEARKPASIPPPSPQAPQARPNSAPPPGAPAVAQATSADAHAAKKPLSKSTLIGSGPGGALSAAVEAARQVTAPPVAVAAQVVSTPPGASAQVIAKREQDATDALPLTYREYVFAVAAGTDESTAERVLRGQLEQIRAALVSAPMGKLVSLAVFDATFSGRPPVPPLAVLQWKDWRVEPVVAFPRRPGYVSPFVRVAASPPPVDAPAAVVAPPPAVVFTPPPPPPPPPAPAVLTPPPPQAPVFTPPPQAPVVVAAAPPVAVPVATPAPQFPPSNRPHALAQTLDSAPPFAQAAPPRRVRGDELIADLFDAMGDLHFSHDAVEGADFCLHLAIEKLGASAGVVHLYEIDRREFVVTATRGATATALLLTRSAENDPLLGEAMRKRRAIMVGAAFGVDPTPIPRYGALGRIESGMVAPVMQAGRFLGAIELLNPSDGAPFAEADGQALDYIAQQLAEFVATTGVVTDPERVSTVASSRRAAAR